MNDRPEVCPGTGQPSAGLALIGDGWAACPICETPQRVWPYPLGPAMSPDARFVLHRIPGPIVCGGSGMPARMSRDECAMCPHPSADHPAGAIMPCCSRAGCECPAHIWPFRCGICKDRVDVAGDAQLAVAHARPESK